MKTGFLFCLFIAFFVLDVYPQNSACQPPEIVFNKNVYNIFDEAQEMHLGEVMAETFEKEYRVIRDEEVNRYVREVGERLVKHLPPTGIKFQFFVVDVPDVNAFAMAGGRIYVTRKLIAFVRNEDERSEISKDSFRFTISRAGRRSTSCNFRARSLTRRSAGTAKKCSR
jgi:predicted Zn-dependent protease